MSKDPKKIVAATLGVIQYLREEKERARQAKGTGVEASSLPIGQPIQPSGSLWASSGRMEIMRFRNLMELRLFRRGR